MIRFIKRLLKDQSGIAATEFALYSPVLITLLMGTIEVSRFVILNQKTEKLANTVGDVVAQSEEVTQSQLNMLFAASQDIMNPYQFGTSGYVIITSATYDDNINAAVVNWQYEGGGTLPGKVSQVGYVGSVAQLPNNIQLNDNENVLVAEVYYQYSPMFADGLINGTTLYKTAIYKPRLGALETPPS